MRHHRRYSLVAAAALAAIMLGVVFASSATRDEDLRIRVRSAANAAGANLSNVSARVDSDRRVIIFNGTLGSTQELFSLFACLTNYADRLTTVQQAITTPQGCPFPQWFDVGFDPWRPNKTAATAATNAPPQPGP